MRTVLIADDSSANRELFRAILESSGVRVIEASNGIEALRILQEFPLDIAFVDIQMPEMDGVGVLRGARAHHVARRVPIVAVTGLAMEGNREQFLAAGFDAYVPKPFAIRSLIAVMESLLGDRKPPDQRSDAQTVGR